MSTRYFLPVLIILPCILLCSCFSLNTSDVQLWEKKTALVALDTAAINGRYANGEEGPITGFYMWDLLFKAPFGASQATDIVDVRVIAPDMVQFSLVRWLNIVETRVVKFEPYDTHILFGESGVSGYPPLLWAIGGDESGFGLTPEGDASIIHTRSGLAFLLIMPVGGAGLPAISSTYPRIP